MKDQYNHKYDDIINLPHPTSKKHPRMSLYARAAQFSPFAALTGHEAAIKETVRQTDAKQMSVYAPAFLGFAKVPPMAHRMMSAASFTIFQRQEKTK